VDGRLLVAHVDDPDPLVEATVGEHHDMATGKREDTLDARLLERASGELPTVYGHGETSMRYGRTDGITRCRVVKSGERIARATALR
jgi:hypothetical protein